MINEKDLENLCNYFADKEIPEELETLVKKLNLMNQMRIINEKLNEITKEK